MFSFLAPDYRVRRVQDLSIDHLRWLDIHFLLLDADCTLKRYRSEECEPGVRQWLETLRDAKIGLCLVSNGFGPRIARFAASVELPYVAQAMKPSSKGCRRAIQENGFQADRTAMAGDQLFADILAGRLAGLTTILVDAIHPEEERWFTRIKRGPERYLLRNFEARRLVGYLAAEP